MCDNAFDDIFGTKEMNIPTLREMQMLKKKRKRRTREEIENDKKNENTSEQKVDYFLGIFFLLNLYYLSLEV